MQYPIFGRRAVEKDRSCGDTAPEQVILDLNELGKGKPFISLGAFAVSDDGRKLLYATDETGFRQYDLFVKDLGTGQVKGPLARRVTGAEWAADSATILYATEDETTKRSDTVWRLPPGGPAVKAFEEKDELFRVGVARTKDCRYLLSVSTSTDTWETRVVDARTPSAPLRLVVPRKKGHKYDLDHRGGLFYIRTNDGAKDFRVVTAPVANPSMKSWKPFLSARPGEKIVDLEPFRDFIVVTTQEAGLPRFRIHDFRKKAWAEIAFPDPVYMASATPLQEFETGTFRFRYESLVTPPTVFDEDLASHARKLMKQEEVLGGYDPTRYSSARLWATARDGTRVPVSIVHRKDVARDGQAPLWLYGYGSYGYGAQARFDRTRIPSSTAASPTPSPTSAVATRWARPGTTTGCSCGRRTRFTTSSTWRASSSGKGGPRRTGCSSRAAAPVACSWCGRERAPRPVPRRPRRGPLRRRHEHHDGCHAAGSDPRVPGVGNPGEKPAFAYMRSYSPYDNLAAGAYPAILGTTSFNDSQVMYWEPAKYVAKLRTLKTDVIPLLLKTKLDPAGHGGASGRYDALRDRAFEVAWMLSQVGIAK